MVIKSILLALQFILLISISGIADDYNYQLHYRSGLWRDLTDVEIYQEYIYCHTPRGFQILRIGDSGKIELVKQLDLGFSHHNLLVDSSWLYCATDDSSILVYSLENPENPQPAGRYKGIRPSVPVGIDGNLLFAGAKDSLVIIDITDKSSPSFLGIHPIAGNLADVEIDDTIAYVAARDFVILDISDPSAPREIALYDIERPFSSVGIEKADTIIFLGEDSFIDPDNYSSIEIVNVADPSQPKRICQIIEWCATCDIKIADRYLYAALGLAGVAVFDISRIDSLVPLARHCGMGSVKAIDLTNEFILAGSDYFSAGRQESRDSVFGLNATTVPKWPEAADHPLKKGDLFCLKYDRGENKLRATGSFSGCREPASMATGDSLVFTGGMGVGIEMINLADPDKFQVLACPDTPMVIYDMKAFDNYLVVNSHFGRCIFDIHNPFTPKLINHSLNERRPVDIAIENDIVYIANPAGDIDIFDFKGNDTLEPVYSFAPVIWPYRIAVDNNHLFIADTLWNLSVFNTDDINDPRWVCELPGDSITDKPEHLLLKDNRLIQAGSRTVRIVDISDITKPIALTTFDHDEFTFIKLTDRYLYLGNDEDLFLLDITDPYHPKQVGICDLKTGEKTNLTYHNEYGDYDIIDNRLVACSFIYGVHIFDIEKK